ncbi:MAG: exodeoxyribonuclease VII large subunit, partial [Acutalibacteraceae bacterium]|nr:exodeoxyribonuclease VII large subunit [Acutalibacteraceae bacterium]
QYQFYAEEMLPAGIGDIALKFEQTKEKLKKEGLFDSESKRPLVKFPKRIAVVTSPTGAAVRDIFNILSRRWPLAEIIMCPVSVQGELAVPEMLKTLDRVYEVEGVDALIIGRGGGSAEDLWAFNDEALARKIYESPFPVISAVGHETDFTICDFVADLRAPTPSAAAELAVPDIEEVKLKLQRYISYLKNSLNAKYKLYESRLAAFTSNPIIKNPVETLIERNYELIDRLSDNIKDEILEKYKRKENEFLKSVAVLDGLSPLKTLTRGYAWVTSEEKPVKSVNDIEADDILNLIFTDGDAECKVIKKRRV